LRPGRPRKHLGLRFIRPIVRHLCLYSSVISRGTRTDRARGPPQGGPEPLRVCDSLMLESPEPLRACGPLPRGRASNCSGRTEPSISEGGKLWARNGRLLWPCRSDFHENRKGSLTCRKCTTQDPQLYFPSEGRHAQDFLRPEKIRRPRLGLNPRSWVPEASMLTPRPPKPL
jgi:hypothetical protein